MKLTGPVAAHVNVPVQLTVTDGQTGNPVSGATVDGGTTDANGHVTVTFTHAGLQHLKATKVDAIRSNQLTIVVVWFLKKFVYSFYLSTKEEMLTRISEIKNRYHNVEDVRI